MKRWISLSLCFLFCLGLIIPALLAVPVFAIDGGFMSYNGVIFPDTENLTGSSKPYHTILYHVKQKTYYLVLCSCPYTWENNMTSYPKEGSSAGYYYKLNNNVWEFWQSSSSIYFVPYSEDALQFIWTNYDVVSTSDSSIYFAGSEPIDPNVPSIPTLTTSFDGQVINVDAGSVNLYIHATNVNGTLSCEWYINGALYEEVFDFLEVEDGVWLQGWKYTPVENGIREIYAIVKNTCGSNVASVSTGTAILNIGNVSGGIGGSEVFEKLETIDLEISEIKSSVDILTENVEQLPDEIKDGMEQLQEQEKQEANSTGDSSAQEVIDIIPNPSDDFIPAFQNFVSVMRYDGTAAVLTLPAVSIPQIGSIVPNIKLLDAQEIDFSEYVTLVPDLILNFIRALFDSALVIYCLYELFTMIGSALSGFIKNTGKGDFYE